MRKKLCLVFLLFFSFTLFGCNNTSANPTQNPAAQTTTSFPTDTGIIEATPTPIPARVILLASSGSSPTQVEQIQVALTTLSQQAGWLLDVRQGLEVKDLTPDIRLVVVLPNSSAPASELTSQISAWLGAAPQTQFLVLGVGGLAPASNLHVIGDQGMRPDQQGFIAGYVAAVVTWDWRIAVITVSNTSAGKAAGQAFMNGAIFFCGLCRPSYPPFLQYPMYAEISAGAGQNEWQPAVDMLVQNAIKTVYVVPGAGDEAMLNYLTQAGVSLIGSQPALDALRDKWIVSIQPDPVSAIQKIWPGLVSGNAEASMPMPITFSEINPALLSPGRQSFTQKTLGDLLAGFVNTGVDPLTGENK